MRLYGPVHGYGSQTQVTRGFMLALGERVEATVALDEPSGLGTEAEMHVGATARDAVFTGRLDQLEALRMHAQHERRFVMVVPNSNQIGARLAERVNAIATHVITPSSWAAEQLISLVTPPVTVVPHGVFPEYKPIDDNQAVCDTYDRGRFDVLHFSTTAYGRKCTRELIIGWCQALARKWIPDKAFLCMVLDREALLNAHLTIEGVCNAELTKTIRLQLRPGPFGSGVAPQHMNVLYQQAHLVVQPSRGEGFGLVPLEARAAGTPVAATLCTGHSEHMTRETPGLVVVEHGDLTPLDDLPGSVAPSVSPEAIATALKVAYASWSSLSEAARAHAAVVQKLYNWPTVLHDFVQQLDEVTK